LAESESLSATVRASPWWLYVLAYTVLILTSTWVYPTLVQTEFLTALSQTTSQWLDERFVSTLILQSIRVVVVLFVVGRLGLRDVGIRRELILPAIVVLLLLWLSVQTLRTLEGIVFSGRIVTGLPFGGDATRYHAAKAIVIGSVFEEVLFRGFFLLQFYKLARERFTFDLGSAALTSVLASALLFMVAHLPGRLIVNREGLWDMIPSLVRILLVGIVLGVVFARTADIFIAAGLHCFLNLPLNVVRAPEAVPINVQWGIELTLLVIAVHFTAFKVPPNKFIQPDQSGP
jgi:membrane protease YdiL (CAAX protease family)